MWFRSQDKCILIEADKFIIEEKRYCEKIGTIYTVNSDNKQNIYSDWNIIVNDICIGTYFTKEKALNVLDSIELKLNGNLGILEINDDNSCEEIYVPEVYQMPLDSEVEE